MIDASNAIDEADDEAGRPDWTKDLNEREMIEFDQLRADADEADRARVHITAKINVLRGRCAKRRRSKQKGETGK